MTFRVKRVYEAPSASDGRRVLVDRLWPRGLKKTDAALDEWLKDVAPSVPLRRWFGHDPERFTEFKRKYRAELRNNPALPKLRQLGRKHRVTLLYAAHDPEVNHAVVLRSVLQKGSP
ncbi:MAG: DUF488 domain-containing protein [Proteobacteria bacterium]|nr:DUF488 domain-containing protein [Pseudomonadota bacterium]